MSHVYINVLNTYMPMGPLIHIQYLTAGDAIIWSLVLISGNLRPWPWQQQYPSCRFPSLKFKTQSASHTFSQIFSIFPKNILWFVIDFTAGQHVQVHETRMYLWSNSPTPPMLISAGSSSVASDASCHISHPGPFLTRTRVRIFLTQIDPLIIPWPWHQCQKVKLNNKKIID